MSTSRCLLLLLILLGACPARAAEKSAAAAPPAAQLALERQFDVHITVKGGQTWNNPPQHTQGLTTQDYVFSTRLRSDGVLYGDNLLDLDPATRFAVKEQYLARRGLIDLKQMNGGKLPRNAAEVSALTAKAQARMTNCAAQSDCGGKGVELSAALSALPNNSVDDLDALIAAPATGAEAHWLYFFGYAGCPNRIHISSDTHITGERAYNGSKTHLVPWSLDRTANTAGNAEDRAKLCLRYTATVDIRSGDVYLENLYIPSPDGATVRSINGSVERRAEELPVPSEVLSWATAKLRRTRETANFSETLTANAPLDQDSTVLGQFDGQLQTTLSWSFTPVAGAPQAQIPPTTPLK